MSVLSLFSGSEDNFTVREVARRLDLPLSTAHRIVSQFVDLNYLTRSSDGYRVGSELLRISLPGLADTIRSGLVRRVLENARAATGETVGIHVRAGDYRVCVDELESPARVRVVSGVGNSFPLGSAAAGRILCAFLEAGEARTLRSRKDFIIPSSDELDIVRRRGWATSFGETIPGAHAVAVFLESPMGGPPMALNVTGPAGRMRAERLAAIGGVLLDLVARES